MHTYDVRCTAAVTSARKARTAICRRKRLFRVDRCLTIGRSMGRFSVHNAAAGIYRQFRCQSGSILHAQLQHNGQTQQSPRIHCLAALTIVSTRQLAARQSASDHIITSYEALGKTERSCLVLGTSNVSTNIPWTCWMPWLSGASRKTLQAVANSLTAVTQPFLSGQLAGSPVSLQSANDGSGDTI